MAADTSIRAARTGLKKQPSGSKAAVRTSAYVILTLGLSFTVLPFLMMILSSFKTNTEVLRVPPTFFPETFTLENYHTILTDPKLPLLRFYGNSAFVAFFNVASTLFTSALIGYLFAKYEFPGKRLLFGWFLTMMMIPSQITMIPSYLILAKLGLINSLWGLVIFSAVDAFGIFMIRQFCETLPNELIDAGRIDGASEWQIFLRIILPQLKPGLATFGILHFMGSWNAYLWPMIVLQKVEVRTLPIILTWYNSTHTGQGALVMAATVLIMVPILAVFVNFQRWIVQGFTMSGFK
ncbi:MAG: carbohydrate ABC transporter permease [Anaerolineales bacterium]|nr:carbohydrate ABC transporter permease [Anaerolineales bacterium]